VVVNRLSGCGIAKKTSVKRRRLVPFHVNAGFLFLAVAAALRLRAPAGGGGGSSSESEPETSACSSPRPPTPSPASASALRQRSTSRANGRFGFQTASLRGRSPRAASSRCARRSSSHALASSCVANSALDWQVRPSPPLPKRSEQSKREVLNSVIGQALHARHFTQHRATSLADRLTLRPATPSLLAP